MSTKNKGKNGKGKELDIIQQADASGKQILKQRSRISWLLSLCNCFRVVNFGYSTQQDQPALLPQRASDLGRNTLILDLDETLVHSSFTKIKADINIEIRIDGDSFKVYVLKRPGVDEFLAKCAELFEVVVFTASLQAYADPLLDALDPKGLISFRLFRDSCSYSAAGYVKDLSRLGRDLKHMVIVDNSPTSYAYHPSNAIPIKTWIDDKSDKELDQLWNTLQEISAVDDVTKVLGEILVNKMSFDADSIQKAVKSRGVLTNRGPFNSPIHANGDKNFKFVEDDEDIKIIL